MEGGSWNNAAKRILVVDDEFAIRMTLKQVLEAEGFVVTTARNGSEGYEYLKLLPNAPAAIILDLVMPDTNGWQFLDMIRSDPDTKEIPVVVCSAYHESAKSVQPNAILNKPVQLNELLHVVQQFTA